MTILASCLAELCPRCTIIIRDIPVVVFDFELRSDAILTVRTIITILAILTIFAVSTILTVGTISAILSIFAVSAILSIDTYGLDFVTLIVGKPLSVKCPVVNAVAILLDTDNRGVTILAILAINAILTVRAIYSIFTILTMIDGDRC